MGPASHRTELTRRPAASAGRPRIAGVRAHHHFAAEAYGSELNDSEWISRGLRNARLAGFLRMKLLTA